MAVEQIGPLTPVSPPDPVEQELKEAERVREEEARKTERKDQEWSEANNIDEFA